MPSLCERTRELIRAGFSGLYIETDEQAEADRELTSLASRESWAYARWDLDRGLLKPDATQVGPPDPIAAVHNAIHFADQNPETRTLVVFCNLHKLLSAPDVAQAVANAVNAGKAGGLTLAILAPVVDLPTELQRLFVTVGHDLPDRPALEAIARETAEPHELPETPEGMTALLDAASGLTRFEAEGAFALALARTGRVTPDTVWELKAASLKKTGLLQLYSGRETFADLGGLSALKAFGQRALAPRADRKARPRGLMLLGVPGVGKSAFAKALGNETGRPTLLLDLGSMMGSLVGQTEGNIRQALKVADAMAPCVLFLDEVEKGLAGSQAGGATDSGVAARLFGTLLTWLNDHETDVFPVCTSNDISALPPEFTRAERFDAVFFLDFPDAAERDLIWRQYVAHYGLDAAQPRPADEGWTGAEIRAACRLASLLGLPLTDAAQNVVPISATNGDRIQSLRRWASGRALSAGRGGLYRDRDRDGGPSAAAEKPAKPSRKIDRAERTDAA